MGTRREFKEYQGENIGVFLLRKSDCIKNKELKVNRLVKGNG